MRDKHCDILDLDDGIELPYTDKMSKIILNDLLYGVYDYITVSDMQLHLYYERLVINILFSIINGCTPFIIDCFGVPLLCILLVTIV